MLLSQFNQNTLLDFGERRRDAVFSLGNRLVSADDVIERDVVAAAHESGIDPPLLQEHCTRFIATTRRSAPLRRIDTFGLAVGAIAPFSLSIASQRASRRLHAGYRSGRLKYPPS